MLIQLYFKKKFILSFIVFHHFIQFFFYTDIQYFRFMQGFNICNKILGDIKVNKHVYNWYRGQVV